MAGYTTPYGSGASNSGDPVSELNAWKQYRQQFEAQYGAHAAQAPQAAIDQYNGKALSPQAWSLYQLGNGSQHYDLRQGNLADNKGWFSHPESWVQLGLGGAMGAAALGAFGAAGSAAGGGGSAASKAGDVGNVAGGTGAFDESGNWVPDGGSMPSLSGQGLPGSAGFAPGNSFANGIPTDASGWSTLLKAIAGIGGAVGGNALAKNAQANAIPPQLNQLLDLSLQRANAQTPLFNAAQSGLYQMLPDFAKKGGG